MKKTYTFVKVPYCQIIFGGKLFLKDAIVLYVENI